MSKQASALDWRRAATLVEALSGADARASLSELDGDVHPALLAVCWCKAMEDPQAIAELLAPRALAEASTLAFIALERLVVRGADLSFIEAELFARADLERGPPGLGLYGSNANSVLGAMAQRNATFATIRDLAVDHMAEAEIAWRIVQSAERNGWRSEASTARYVELLGARDRDIRRAARSRLGARLDPEWLVGPLGAVDAGLRSKKAGDVTDALSTLQSFTSQECASFIDAILQCAKDSRKSVAERARGVVEHWLRWEEESDAAPLVRAASRVKDDALAYIVAEANRRFAARRGDVKALLKGCKTVQERAACLHRLAQHWREGRDFAPLVAEALAMLSNDDASVRFTALDTLAIVAERGADVAAAGDLATSWLGEDKHVDPVPGGGSWQASSIGYSAAKMLGFGAAAAAGFIERLEQALRSKKRAVRENAALGLGIALSRTERWDILAALMTEDGHRLRVFAGMTFRSLSEAQSRAFLEACRRARFDLARIPIHHNNVNALSKIAAIDSREGLGAVCDELSSDNRSSALRYLDRAVGQGASVQEIVVAITGSLLCGDYSVHPREALEVLASCASSGADVAVAVPFVAPYASFAYPNSQASGSDVRLLAARILAKAIGARPQYDDVRSHVLPHLDGLSPESDADAFDAGNFLAELENAFGGDDGKA